MKMTIAIFTIPFSIFLKLFFVPTVVLINETTKGHCETNTCVDDQFDMRPDSQLHSMQIVPFQALQSLRTSLQMQCNST